MSNPNHTKVLFYLDVSGSMGQPVDNDAYYEYLPVYKAVEDALHQMLEKQARKLAGWLSIDVDYFDDILYEGVRDGDPLTTDLTMFASGGTEIYSNLSQSIRGLRNRINNMPEDEKPGHVVVVIVTDGDSYSGGRAGAHSEVQVAMRAGWDIAFVGTDPGSFSKVSGNIGLTKNNAIYEPLTPEGIEQIGERVGEFILQVRGNERGKF